MAITYVEKYDIDSIADFSAWQGGKAWLDTIIEEDKVDAANEWFANYISELGEGKYPTDFEINEILWFDDDFKREIGLKDFQDEEEE